MDNWFSTLPLLSELKTMGILSMATFCLNRLGGCPWMSQKDLKKHGRDSFDYRKDYNTRAHLLKWFDNKCFVVGSSFAGAECTNTVERYDMTQKKKVRTGCPDMVSQFNRSVNGVDLADMVITLYRTNIITRKRWYPKLIFYCVDIAKVNGLLLHWKHFQQKQINLRTFTTQIDSAFTLAGKDPERLVGRPRHSISPKPPVGRNPAVPLPVADIRFDKVAHWPEIDSNHSHCRKCNMTCTVKCFKCMVGLCLNKNRNSFKDFRN